MCVTEKTRKKTQEIKTRREREKERKRLGEANSATGSDEKAPSSSSAGTCAARPGNSSNVQQPSSCDKFDGAPGFAAVRVRCLGVSDN